jgi:SAM-dependent MidA family methyltransferase
MIGREDIVDELKWRIAVEGSITVAHYMGASNDYYYAHGDPFGAAGDFVTAPEISQMFGELIGAWLADLWQRAGTPALAHYVELGPGRGTLAADALRVMRGAGLDPSVHLVETSARLRAAQAERVPDACWHYDLETVPEDGLMLVVANEFFDALEVHQFDAAGVELRVHYDGGFVRRGVVATERSPAALAIAADLARRLAAQGGAALIVDYGYVGPGTGDTLQAVRRHTYAEPFGSPGRYDLTAHVDFAALAGAAERVRVLGPVEQGAWLEAMGLGLRAAALARAAPERAAEIAAARARLAAPEQMGRLFKAMALVAPGWPEPAGFAP